MFIVIPIYIGIILLFQSSPETRPDDQGKTHQSQGRRKKRPGILLQFLSISLTSEPAIDLFLRRLDEINHGECDGSERGLPTFH